MKLKYDWWFFKKKISIKNCNKIIKLFSSIKKDKGITGTLGVSRNTKKFPLSKKEKQVLKKQRDSSVCFMSHPLIYDIIMPLLMKQMKTLVGTLKLLIRKKVSLLSIKKIISMVGIKTAGTNHIPEKGYLKVK